MSKKDWRYRMVLSLGMLQDKLLKNKFRMYKKKRQEKIDNRLENEWDENFAFIVGHTSGGAPYGVTYEEMKELDSEIKNNLE